MAKKIGEAFVRVRPDTKGFGPEFKHQAESTGHMAGEGFAGSMLKTVGALFAGEKILEFFKGAIERATDSAKLGRLTDAVIKSTGGAARVSAGHVDELAKSLSGVTGVDNELIRSSENVLLTFTGVRNQVGKGNDIFDQATVAIGNMSAALGQDLQSSTIQVGKALNDPIKGMTALRRVGVSFTAAQIEQVKHLVKTGHVMDAQKLILKELGTEFGHAAEAAATGPAKAKVAWQNFQESIGNLLLPLVGKIFGFFTNTAIPAITKFIDVFKGAFSDGTVSLTGFWGLVQSVAATLSSFWATLTSGDTGGDNTGFNKLAKIIHDYVFPAIRSIVDEIKTLVIQFGEFLGWVGRGSSGALAFKAIVIGLVAAWVAYKVAMTAIAIWTKIVTVGQWLLNAALDANPIGVIILVIIALVAAFIYLWTHSEGFRKFWIGLWDHIKAAAVAVGHWFAHTLPGYFVTAWNFLVKGAQTLRDSIIAHLRAIVDWVNGLPGRLLDLLKNLGSLLLDSGKNLVRGLINGVLSMGAELADKVTKFISDHVPGPIKNLLGIGSPSKLFAEFGRDTIRGYWLGVKQEAANTRNAITGAIPRTPAALGMAATGGGTISNTFHVTSQDPATLAKIVTREQAWATGV